MKPFERFDTHMNITKLEIFVRSTTAFANILDFEYLTPSCASCNLRQDVFLVKSS